ncbi:MAG: ATP-dependent 6-phosphofructokinase [Elusimicrobia bacterium]|nr:ATP-dependent 6-phosphofructokinase [Elusimicrobiota bacterium]MBD3412445.1 ATP-dependent 6-phosphofructokinase [Elusimicrobiota bacterium]
MRYRKQGLKRVGILTGGGDCPGLNAVIRAVTKTVINQYCGQVIGFEDGYAGVINGIYHTLTYKQVSGILTQGGTILGTSNKSSPFEKAIHPDTQIKMTKTLKKTLSTIHNCKIDVLMCIGGDGTLSIAEGLFRMGIPVIGIPKTIDNDLEGTDFTFGFNTAVQIASDAVDRLHSTAMSHHRVMVVEVMGRYAGWLALYSGVAGGGDIILIPEIPYKLDVICKRVLERHRKGKRFSIIVIAEGAKPVGGTMMVSKRINQSPDPIRLGGISRVLANQIEEETGLEVRVTNLGHLQRGGTPTVFDRLLATRFGVEAVHRASDHDFGTMVALRGKQIVTCRLRDAVLKLKKVSTDDPFIQSAQSVGTSFGI